MDWAELNRDLLRLISKKLGDIYNFVRFRAVCKNWRLAVDPRDWPPQLPWFIEHRPATEADYTFFSLYSNRTHAFPMPQAKGKVIFGTSNRYLLKQDFKHRSASLFNPLTRSRFSIPQFENYKVSFPIYIGRDLNPNPNQNENGDIVVFFLSKVNGFPSVVFYQLADQQIINTVEVPYANSIAYFQGRLFVNDMEAKETRVLDVTNGNNVLIISSPRIGFNYMIDACGELLGVVKCYIKEEWQFEVYHLEDGGTNFSWVKMTSGIGDRMLFLNGHRLRGGLCLKASDFDGFTGNCIYFAQWSPKYCSGDCKFVLCRYDLDRKETQVLPHPLAFPGAWFLPSLC